MSKLGRNDPCHCGSGKKYKKCHEPLEQERQREERSLRTLSEWVDFHGRALVEATRARAAERPEVVAAAARFFGDAAPADPLADAAFAQHAVFDLAIDAGRPLIASDAASTEADGGADEDARDRVLRSALAATHPSLYEVVACRRGRSLRLADRLTGVETLVADPALSERLDPMEVVVGRLVRLEEGNVLLDGWSKVRFRGRKAAIRALREDMAAAGLPDDDVDSRVAWLRREAGSVYRHARAGAPAEAAPGAQDA